MEEVPRGRPRDARIDEAVLEATRDLLATGGFAATTVQSVARSAGVGASAIYRRWPSRLELIAAAIGRDLDRLEFQATGDLRADLRAFVDAYLDLYSSPAAHAGLPGVLSAARADSVALRALTRRVGQGVRPAFRAVLAAAPEGSVDPVVDPDTVLDILIGAALYQAFIRPHTGRDGGAEQVADVLLRALRP